MVDDPRGAEPDVQEEDSGAVNLSRLPSYLPMLIYRRNGVSDHIDVLHCHSCAREAEPHATGSHLLERSEAELR